MKGIYEAAEVYHYGFGFRDTKKEAAILVAASDRFGNGGRCFLEVACGDCPYALDLMDAGIEFHGLDISPEMLRFSAERIKAAGWMPEGHLHLADMRDFSLPKTFDLAFVLMGSLHYLCNEEFLRHLDRLYLHMKPGGLYVLEWCIEYSPSTEQQSAWTQDSPLGEIGVSYSATQRSAVDQAFVEKIDLAVNGTLVASTTDDVYKRYPNEFDLLLQMREAQWEIVDSFNDWDIDIPVLGSSKVNRPLCILRKRAE